MRRMIAAVAAVSCLVLPLSAGDSYSSIDGTHLKRYVEDLAAMSRRYRDNGHPQFWGRITGTEADAARSLEITKPDGSSPCATMARSTAGSLRMNSAENPPMVDCSVIDTDILRALLVLVG